MAASLVVLPFFGIKLPKLLLKYPPEYAQTIIRDRTDIGWLQEYVIPVA